MKLWEVNSRSIAGVRPVLTFGCILLFVLTDSSEDDDGGDEVRRAAQVRQFPRRHSCGILDNPRDVMDASSLLELMDEDED